MPSRFRHAALVGKYQARGIRGVLEEIAHFLARQGLDVSLERQTALSTGMTGYGALEPDAIGRECDLVVVLGGDGTMLGIARQLARYGTPLVGINQGDWASSPTCRWASSPNCSSRCSPATSRSSTAPCSKAASSATASASSRRWRSTTSSSAAATPASMLEVRVEIGAEFMANLRADGLILASPTGSTAYALSAGGPILHPSIAGWVLAPIASHAVQPPHRAARRWRGDDRDRRRAGRASVNFDMQSLASLLPGDRICVRRSQHRVHFLHPRGWSYYATLRRKLHWHEGRGVKLSPKTPAASPPRGAFGLGGPPNLTTMLRRLALRDFVIVPALEVELGAGFTALTGETGAGKSILVDALQLALGGRGDAGVVREGAPAPRSAPSSTRSAPASRPGSPRPASPPR